MTKWVGDCVYLYFVKQFITQKLNSFLNVMESLNIRYFFQIKDALKKPLLLWCKSKKASKRRSQMHCTNGCTRVQNPGWEQGMFSKSFGWVVHDFVFIFDLWILLSSFWNLYLRDGGGGSCLSTPTFMRQCLNFFCDVPMT